VCSTSVARSAAALGSQRRGFIGPLVARDLVLNLSAIAAGHERFWGSARKGAHVAHPDRGHHGPGWIVDRERLAEDAIQTDLDEAVAQQFARALVGQSLAPPSRKQPVAEIGFARDLSLVGP
jgi:hypothetical protein